MRRPDMTSLGKRKAAEKSRNPYWPEIPLTNYSGPSGAYRAKSGWRRAGAAPAPSVTPDQQVEFKKIQDEQRERLRHGHPFFAPSGPHR
ncbi:MAG TPA: hypothetical protein VGI85_10630 [Chthoniobacterales bacterium]